MISVFVVVVAAGASALGIFYLIYILSRKVDVAGPPSPSFLIGCLNKIYNPRRSNSYQEYLLDTYGQTSSIPYLCGTKLLFTSDPKALNAVLVKQASSFRKDRGMSETFDWILGPGLLSMADRKHKIQRKTLNPVFVAAHLRALMDVFSDIAYKARSSLSFEVDKSRTDVKVETDVLKWMNLTALDLIGEAGMGYSFKSLDGLENEYNTAIKSLLPFIFHLFPFYPVLPYIYQLGTPAFRRFVSRRIPFAPLRRLIRLIDVDFSQARAILDERKEALATGADLSDRTGGGKDMMTLILKQTETADPEDKMTDEEIIGQMNTFIFAGHETTSGALTRILSALADDQVMQDRLRAELAEAKGESDVHFDYESINALPYMDAIIHECLRLYTPVAQMERIAAEDVVIPLSNAVKSSDGKTEVTEVFIPKGTKVVIGIHASNVDKAVWGEDARVFNVERWLRTPTERSNIETGYPGIYSSMMTFSAGSRSCIGFKFALLEIKIVLAALIPTLRFEPSDLEFVWESQGTQTPYLKEDVDKADRFPKFMLKVSQL